MGIQRILVLLLGVVLGCGGGGGGVFFMKRCRLVVSSGGEKLGTWGGRNDAVMDCEVCVDAGGDLWVSIGGGGQIGGGFSHESEHDLAMMVSDFLENGSVGAESWCSSDSDSGLSDFAHLAEKIQVIIIKKQEEPFSFYFSFFN